MDNLELIILCGLFVLLGLAIGYGIGRKQRRPVAMLVIDPIDPEVNGGVYIVWEENPHELVRNKVLKNGQLITMELAVEDVVRKSQQNQGA